MAGRSWLRAGLALLAVIQVAAGAWALLLPRSFYDDGPWVAMLPPFNEHLVRDVGAFNLALGVVLAAAAVAMERRLVMVAVAAYLTFTVPHLAFHVTHLDGYPRQEAIAQTAALAVAVLIPVALLLLVRSAGQEAPSLRSRPRRRRSPAGRP